jgi:hypothetical protein
VSHNAIAHYAKSGQIDEKPFLEEGEWDCRDKRISRSPKVFQMISGASGVETKKLGTRPKRAATDC